MYEAFAQVLHWTSVQFQDHKLRHHEGLSVQITVVFYTDVPSREVEGDPSWILKHQLTVDPNDWFLGLAEVALD